MSETPKIEVGKTYLVHHKMRGKFTLRITDIEHEWVTGVIVSGKAEYVLREDATEGDTVTSRISFCRFREVKT